MNKKQITTKTYNDHATDFFKKFENIGPRVKAIKLAFSHTKKDNPAVLELGCAYGREAKEIIKRTDNYIGIDIAKEFIKLAQLENRKGKFIIADQETYQFPKNLDIIFAFASLLHSDRDQVEKIIDQSYNCLNKSGIFYISTKPADHYKEDSKTDEYGTRYYYFYSLEDFQKMSENKFKIIHNIVEKNQNGVPFMEIILQKI